MDLKMNLQTNLKTSSEMNLQIRLHRNHPFENTGTLLSVFYEPVTLNNATLSNTCNELFAHALTPSTASADISQPQIRKEI